MQALVVTSGAPHSLALGEVPEPVPARDEAVVAVRAISLNRGEVRGIATSEAGARPGWDVAGVVLAPAANGSGPAAGTHVVGLVAGRGWAQRVAVGTARLAALPDGVSFAAASTLPVAGMTALRSLALGGLLLGKSVLVTGAAGGVGRFAVQLAARAGARVTGVAGSVERGAGLEALGAAEVITSFAPNGPYYDVILESAGGPSLAAALARVAPDGIVISYGNSSRESVTFEASDFFPKSGARLYGLRLFRELEREASGSRDLGLLAKLVSEKKLDPQIALETSWREPAPALAALLDRRVAGKAVLIVE